jgi:hypothetical protein
LQGGPGPLLAPLASAPDYIASQFEHKAPSFKKIPFQLENIQNMKKYKSKIALPAI